MIRTKEFQYINQFGTVYTVTTDGTDTTNPFGTWHDPEWKITEEPGNTHQWLTYLGQDRQLWMTRFHVRGPSNNKWNWSFENKLSPDGDGRDGGMVFRNAAGEPCRITDLEFVMSDPKNNPDKHDVYFLIERELRGPQ